MKRADCPGRADIWRWPVLLGALTAIGLVSALFSDGGFGDSLAAACLAAPLGVGLWFGCMRRHGGAEGAGRRGRARTR